MPPAYLLYGLACLVSIIPTITSWITLLAPRYDGIKHTGALAVTPPPNHDGPSIWLGLLRTCSRANAALPTECDQYSNSHLSTDFKYDVSILPPDAPLFTLRVPAAHLRGLAVTAAVFSLVFTTMAFFMSLIFYLDKRDRENRERELDTTGLDLDGLLALELEEDRNLLRDDEGRRDRFDAFRRNHPARAQGLEQLFTRLERLNSDSKDFAKQITQRQSILEGLRILSAAVSLGFGFIGGITFAILWVHYERACRNFNLIYKRNGTPAIPLEASLGLTFNLAYAGYILTFIPLCIVFYELHAERDNWRWVNEGRGVLVQRAWNPVVQSFRGVQQVPPNDGGPNGGPNGGAQGN